MAQVAILVNGSPDPRKTQIATTLSLVLGCPVLTPASLQESLLKQTGPVAPRSGLTALAGETIWRTAGLIEAGVVLDAVWGPTDRDAVEAGLGLAGAPRLVEVFCGEGTPVGLTPVVEVDLADDVDMDDLVVRISALFV